MVICHYHYYLPYAAASGSSGKAMQEGETLTTFDTLLYACSVEFCPIEGYREALVCGTYQLNETTRLRAGSLWLHRLDLESEEEEVLALHTPKVIESALVFELFFLFLLVSQAQETSCRIHTVNRQRAASLIASGLKGHNDLGPSLPLPQPLVSFSYML